MIRREKHGEATNKTQRITPRETINQFLQQKKPSHENQSTRDRLPLLGYIVLRSRLSRTSRVRDDIRPQRLRIRDGIVW